MGHPRSWGSVPGVLVARNERKRRCGSAQDGALLRVKLTQMIHSRASWMRVSKSALRHDLSPFDPNDGSTANITIPTKGQVRR